MRILYSLIFLFISQSAISQGLDNYVENIFNVVEEMPRFPGCEVSNWTIEEKKECAQEKLLQFIYGNVKYPETARDKNVEGKVVVQFVVDKDGGIRDPKVVKDIGHGCGDEVIRIVKLMGEKYYKWTPGMHKGEAVAVNFTLPVNFKLEKVEPPLPYEFIDGDTVYHTISQGVTHVDGIEKLDEFLLKNTIYPSKGLDNCSVGSFTVNILVRDDATVKVLNTVDYNNLGTDFLFEAIRVAPLTAGKWNPAIYEGRKVNAPFSLRVEFIPQNEACKSVVANYKKGRTLAEEGIALHNEEKSEEGLLKIDEALKLFPKNTEWLYYRGMVLFGMEQNDKACENFQEIRNILSVPWYDKWIDIVCGM